jgi:HEAT repeat protein
MQRYASDALAVLSLSSENRNRMEQVQDMVPTLIELCGLDREPEVQRNAAAALGNMAFGHIGNQTSIGDSGGIEALCTLCGLSVDVDVLENATSALVNLSRNHEQNALRVGTAYGIEALVRLTNSTATADLSSPDGERVQGNAAEALVNATRNDSHENAERIRSCGVRPIVLMCTSGNLIVKRAAPLVLGNIAQNDAIRAEVGSAGGIDALFLLAGSDDEIVQSNAAYAMGNLAWTASNQERIGFFMPQLLQLLHSAFAPVRENAMIALANAIHFHESNRRRLMFEAPGSLELLVRMIDDNSPLVRAHTARCLGAACHNDTVAKAAGNYTGCISGLIRLLRDRDGQCQRYAAFALKNLALYDPNKRVILENNGVEGLTHVAGSNSHEAREMASAVMDVLADLAGEDEMEAMKDKFGVGGMVDLLRTNAHNPLVAGLAADSLAEKVYGGKPSDHDAVVSAGGVEALLELLAKGQEKDSEDPTSSTMGPYTLKTLWSLRTMLRRHAEAQTRAGAANGIRIMINYVDMEKNGGGAQREHLHEIQSTALSILTMIVQDHEINSRKLLRGGLDSIIALAEKILPEPQRKSRKPTPKDPSMSPGGINDNQLGDARPESGSPPGGGPPSSSKRRGPVTPMDKKKPWQTIRGDEKNASAMALDILQYIGPHNWILCTNCGTRNSGGEYCVQCSYAISFKA